MTGGDTEPGALSRRGLLTAVGALATATATGCAGSRAAASRTPAARARPSAVVPFHGRWQAGVTTTQQRHLRFAAFDLATEDPVQLQALLRAWSDLASVLTAGRTFTDADPAKSDSAEADGLSPARLTITFGLGPSLFAPGRLGLEDRRPAALAPLPSFAADALQERRCDGDLGVQICSDDSQVAFHAFHALTNAARGLAEPRWLQSGFLGNGDGASTHRNLLGFKDGTRNLDAAKAGGQLWAQAGDGAPWMAGGTYLVARRIRTVLDVWDATSVSGQEAAIGRRKRTGAPLGGHAEHDTPDLAAVGAGGHVIPGDAHIRLAAPESNGGAQILRRGYNFDDGIDHTTAQVDAGLFFICFQRDPRTQFTRIQRRLGTDDALSQHLIHTGSALFACPPGTRRGYVGETLFDAA
jgi:deferrochelatase/peroxidase EfeB